MNSYKNSIPTFVEDLSEGNNTIANERPDEVYIDDLDAGIDIDLNAGIDNDSVEVLNEEPSEINAQYNEPHTDSIKVVLNNLKSNCNELLSYFENNSSDSSALKKKIEEYAHTISEMKSVNESKEKEIENKEKEIENLKQIISSKDGQINEYKEKLKNLENKLMQFDQIVSLINGSGSPFTGSHIQPEPEPEPVIIPEPEPEPEPIIIPEPEIEPEPVIIPDPEPVPEPEPVIIPDPEPVPEPEPVIIPEPELEPILDYIPDIFVEPITEPEIESIVEPIIEPVAENDIAPAPDDFNDFDENDDAGSSEKTVCPFCGEELEPDMRFCTNCGKELYTEPEKAADTVVDLGPIMFNSEKELAMRLKEGQPVENWCIDHSRLNKLPYDCFTEIEFERVQKAFNATDSLTGTLSIMTCAQNYLYYNDDLSEYSPLREINIKHAMYWIDVLCSKAEAGSVCAMAAVTSDYLIIKNNPEIKSRIAQRIGDKKERYLEAVKIAIDNNDPKAMVTYAFFHLSGKEGKLEEEKDYYKRAGLLGSSEAYDSLFYLTDNRYYSEEGFNIMVAAAECNDCEVAYEYQCRLGDAYRYGEGWIKTPDLNKARYWYTMAANNGYQSAISTLEYF